jgi:Tol biopolymer transport system component
MNADGSDKKRITSGSRVNSGPDWSPDGSKIVFSSSILEQNAALVTVNPDGSGFTRLTNRFDFFPAWAPEGTKIAFESRAEGHYEIFTVNPDGSGRNQVTSSSSDDINADWQQVP